MHGERRLESDAGSRVRGHTVLSRPGRWRLTVAAEWDVPSRWLRLAVVRIAQATYGGAGEPLRWRQLGVGLGSVMATSGGTGAYANEARATRTRAAAKSGFPPRSVPARTAAGRLRASQLPPGASNADALRHSVAGMRPSQVPVRDGTTRLTGSPALAGGRAHHARKGLRPSATSMGAALVTARSAAVPLRPTLVSAQIQRCGGVQCPPGTCDHDQDETAHRSGDGTPGPAQIPPSVATVLGTPGRALDASTRSGVEERLGHDFGQVRVHTDAVAAQSAHAIHAQAYTLGRHVVMGEGRYQPDTSSGMQLLIHELTHVVQQGNPAADTGPARAISQHHDTSEREASHVAGTLTGSPGTPTPPGLLHRQDDDTDAGTSPPPVTDDGSTQPSVTDASLTSSQPDQSSSLTSSVDASVMIAGMGGPYHPPEGTELSCSMDDSCSALSQKINYLRHTIRRHQEWDAANPDPAYPNGRHALEISDLLRALANCTQIANTKCANQPQWVPAPKTEKTPEQRLEEIKQQLFDALPWAVAIAVIGIVAACIIAEPCGAAVAAALAAVLGAEEVAIVLGILGAKGVGMPTP